MSNVFSIGYVVTLSLLMASSLAYADKQGPRYYENVDWVKNAQQGIPNKAKGKLDVGDYCSGQGCESDIQRPEQANLSVNDLKTQKQTEMRRNEQAKAVKGRFDEGRPAVKNDPAYEFALIAQNNAYEITHGISNQYVDCDNAQQCAIDYIPKTCRKPTNNNVPCTKSPLFSVESTGFIETKICRYSAGGNYNFWMELWGGGFYAMWDGYLLTGDMMNTKYSRGKLVETNGSGRLYEVCTAGEKKCPVGYTKSGGNCIKNTMSWQNNCHLLKECRVVSQRCIEGRATRRINGIPTTLNCWKYQINHQCSRDNTCNALPANCTTTATHCSAKQKGVCIEEELKKSCPEKRCSSTSLTCGEESFCLDGDCYGEMPTPSQDFNESAAALAALSKAAEGLGNPPKIFTGQGQKCRKTGFGFANCCKDGGWGTDVGLAKCSEEEKALGKAKEDKLTIYLGTYCSKKVLGKCLRKKQSYCVFDSLLARIIQQQGVQGQLGLSLGTPKVPTCGAITPEQMQQINFKDIDFSDFFGEMNSNTDLPSAKEIQERISSAMGG